MAVIQYTALVSGIQGKIAGTVLSKGRSGQVAYSKGSPRQEGTRLKFSRRRFFTASVNAWNSLTQAQKNDWADLALLRPVTNRFGEETFLTGYALFMRSLLFQSPRVQPFPMIAKNLTTPIYTFETSASVFQMSLRDEGFFIDTLNTSTVFSVTSPKQNVVNNYISLPVTNTEDPYFGTWYLFFQNLIIPNLPINTAIPFTFSNLRLPAGFRSFPGAKHLIMRRTMIPDEGKTGVEKIISVTASFPPVVVFPPFTVFSLNGATSFQISTEPVIEIFLIYETSQSPTPDWTDYEIQIQFAPPQSGQSAPSASAWGSLITRDITPFVGNALFSPTNPGGSSALGPVYYSQFGSVVYPIDDSKVIPVRARLKLKSSTAVGTWVTIFLDQQVF